MDHRVGEEGYSHIIWGGRVQASGITSSVYPRAMPELRFDRPGYFVKIMPDDVIVGGLSGSRRVMHKVV